MKNMNVNMKLIFVSLLIAGLFLISACASKTANGDDSRICTKEYMPVCGVDGVTYGNKCMAGDVEIAKQGECETEGNVQIANPASTFCVDNGGSLEIKTAEDGSQVGYCKLKGVECEEWTLFRGECQTVHVCTETEKSAELCTMEYMPVCGNDGQTYGNKCSACSAKINYWTIGECGATCGECPLLSQPSPEFCKDGTIVSGGQDSCGCNLPPKCE